MVVAVVALVLVVFVVVFVVVVTEEVGMVELDISVNIIIKILLVI